MDLILVRHAIAVPHSPASPDSLRPLTPQGRERFARCVAGLARLELRLDGVYHSPWQRAVETAAELATLADGQVEASGLLAGAPDERLLELVREHDSAALVGHEPWISQLLGLCLTERSQDLGAVFKKGGVAWLRGHPSPGGFELLALLPPRVLVKLA